MQIQPKEITREDALALKHADSVSINVIPQEGVAQIYARRSRMNTSTGFDNQVIFDIGAYIDDYQSKRGKVRRAFWGTNFPQQDHYHTAFSQVRAGDKVSVHVCAGDYSEPLQAAGMLMNSFYLVIERGDGKSWKRLKFMLDAYTESPDNRYHIER